MGFENFFKNFAVDPTEQTAGESSAWLDLAHPQRNFYTNPLISLETRGLANSLISLEKLV